MSEHSHPSPGTVRRALSPKQRAKLQEASQHASQLQNLFEQARQAFVNQFELVLDAHDVPEADYPLWQIDWKTGELVRPLLKETPSPLPETLDVPTSPRPPGEDAAV